MYMCTFHYFNYYLPDFVTAICLGFIFHFPFLSVCFNLTQCLNKPLVESSFMTRDQALSLWSGNTDSKTLGYQRTNPREYQIVRTHTNETTWIQDQASPNHQEHPVWDAPSKQQTKQNKQTQSSTDMFTTSLSLAHQRKNKQTNKNSAQISPYMKLTQTTGPNLRGVETKRRKEYNLETWEKETPNTIS